MGIPGVKTLAHIVAACSPSVWDEDAHLEAAFRDALSPASP